MSSSPTICLVTPTQPTLNPRLVKEADALAECGYRVEVVCCYFQPWAVEADRLLLESRSWSYSYAGGDPGSWKYRWTRGRHGVARRSLTALGMRPWLRRYALSRCFVEMERKACAIPADLYIAHNLEALPAVAAAAAKHGKPFGFDAEDLHSGMILPPPYDRLIEWMEREYLPRCAYVTASSPSIGEAYASRYGIPLPPTVLNVFPLSLRRQIPAGSTDRTVGPLRLYWFSQTIGAHRGLEEVIEAMGSLPGCDIELHLQGLWQAGYQEQLYACAQRAGVRPERIFGHAPVDADQIIRLSAQYDVGLALEVVTHEYNRRLCLTNKLFTYILAGNAVIASATEAQTALVQSLGPAGFVYPNGDIATLAEGLRRWYNDRTLLRAARAHAWNLGTTRYNWDIEKQIFLESVERVLPAPIRRPAATPAAAPLR